MGGNGNYTSSKLVVVVVEICMMLVFWAGALTFGGARSISRSLGGLDPGELSEAEGATEIGERGWGLLILGRRSRGKYIVGV